MLPCWWCAMGARFHFAAARHAIQRRPTQRNARSRPGAARRVHRQQQCGGEACARGTQACLFLLTKRRVNFYLMSFLTQNEIHIRLIASFALRFALARRCSLARSSLASPAAPDRPTARRVRAGRASARTRHRHARGRGPRDATGPHSVRAGAGLRRHVRQGGGARFGSWMQTRTKRKPSRSASRSAKRNDQAGKIPCFWRGGRRTHCRKKAACAAKNRRVGGEENFGPAR